MITTEISLSTIPQDLQDSDQWVMWRTVARDGHPTKVPYAADGSPASSTDATTWTDFHTAAERVCVADGWDGIGFVFAADDPYCGIDLDGCRDPKTGTIDEWAQEWIVRLDSYTEVSPSGTGVKVFLRGRNPRGSGGNKKVEHPDRHGKAPGVEIYDHGRYFSVTGWHVESTPRGIEARQDAIDAFVAAFWPSRKVDPPPAAGPARSDIVERCWRYVSKMPDAISGSGGHAATYAAACECFRFGLTDDEAAEVLSRFNATKTGDVPWTERELRHKLDDARQRVTADGEFGARAKPQEPYLAYAGDDSPADGAQDRAYRAAYLAAATAATSGHPDKWSVRQRLRDAADARHRAKLAGDDGVTLATHRGTVQAISATLDAIEAAEEAGLSNDDTLAIVLTPWLARLAAWSTRIGAMAPPPGWQDHAPREVWDTIREERAGTPEAEDATEDAPRPLVRTVRELLTAYPTLRRPVIHGLLREGETANIISAPKIGKSWLATDLALSVATGCDWLGRYRCEPGEVLIIDNELHGETSAHRIPIVADARGIHLHSYGDRVHVANLRGALASIVDWGPIFERFAPHRLRVVIVDAFYRALPAGTDENDNGAVAGLYNLIDQYAIRLGCAFVLIHHTSKGNQSGKSVTDVGSGAGSQSRATDTHLVLRQHVQDGAVVLDAAVRSWKPIDPCCLRWTFPVFAPADDLCPEDLRPERPQRRAAPKPKATATPERPPAEPWTAARFATEIVGTDRLVKSVIVQRATVYGMSKTHASDLLDLALAEKQLHEWTFGRNRKIEYATVPQTAKAADLPDSPDLQK